VSGPDVDHDDLDEFEHLAVDDLEHGIDDDLDQHLDDVVDEHDRRVPGVASWPFPAASWAHSSQTG
jgi:hypothetical protein